MKKRSVLAISIIALVALANWAPNSYARSSFYSDNCAVCHGSTSGVAPYPDNTCAGCHSHGVHPDSNKDSMNITATPDNTTYGPSDTILIEVGGSYRDGWVRVQMWDLDCSIADTCIQGNVLVEESLYTSGPTVTFPGPVTLIATAPAIPGDYTWYAGWYGNVFDKDGAAFGLWIPDTTNSNHGNELVAFNFTVTGCTVNADCDDGVFCNGAETCDNGTCVGGTPPDCDDGVGCTVDTCDEISDTCVNTPDDLACPDDGLFCTGQEICDPAAGCVSTGDPCPEGMTCNEDTDTCDPSGESAKGLPWLMLLLDDGPNLPVCGNGKLEADEECDDGNNDNLDTCLDTCVSASCGDGFTQSGVETCDDGNLEDGDGCEYDCTITEKDRVVFLTSIEYTGNLGGLAGADTICNQLASDAQLSGTYKAWLSDDTTSVADRFTHHGQFVLVNESPVATSWSDLTDESIINPIIMDENGNTHAGEIVWGNTDWDGSRDIYAESCLNWTKESYDSIQDIYRGTGVYSYHNDYRWSYPSPSIQCDSLYRLYCFEQ